MAIQKENTRMDRVEKNIEVLLKGVYELKESQKKTDAQMRRTDEQLRRTDAKLDRIGKQPGELGLVQGEVAEDLFYRVLTQTEEGGAAILNRKDFKAKEFS